MYDKKPLISIVIPYYNHGIYVEDTIASIETIEGHIPYEIIIVNDGSTDEFSNEVLKKIEGQKKSYITIIYQKNQGVCRARNKALENARGKYILPVDSDNMIYSSYVSKAIQVLEENQEYSVVYADCELLGEESGIRIAGPYNLQRLMLANFIDNCSVFRRSMLEDIGYIDTYKTINATEDWEYWLRASFKGHKFYYINEPLFKYRVLKSSGSAQLNADKIKGNSNMEYFKEKHSYYFGPQYVDAYFTDKFKKSPVGFIGKLILKVYFPKMFNRLTQKGRLRKYI